MKLLALLLPLTFLIGCQTEGKRRDPPKAKIKAPVGTTVVIDTSQGSILVELDDKKAPGTVKNFLSYVDQGFYDNTTFHRVISHFMIQGGGFTLKEGILNEKTTGTPIANESAQTPPNTRGTLAMARKPDPNSATSQFFINVADNNQLNHPNSNGSGYAVFGKIIKGMEAVDAIKAVQAGTTYANVLDATGIAMPTSMKDVPVEPVVIKSIRRTLKLQ